MNCQPQKEISKVTDFPNKELDYAFGVCSSAKKLGEKKKKSI
jgi:hypothetical protein